MLRLATIAFVDRKHDRGTLGVGNSNVDGSPARDLVLSNSPKSIETGNRRWALRFSSGARLGSATFAQSLKSLAPGGRLVVVGNLETATVYLNPGLVIVKELEILGAYATTLEELEQAFALVASGQIKPWISESMPLADAARAHFRLESREIAGRLVLIPPAA